MIELFYDRYKETSYKCRSVKCYGNSKLFVENVILINMSVTNFEVVFSVVLYVGIKQM